MLERADRGIGEGEVYHATLHHFGCWVYYVWVLDRDRKMGVGLDWVEVVCAVDMKRNNVRLAECRGNQLD